MFCKKNVRVVLSLIIFLVSISSFTMLQGFDLSENSGSAETTCVEFSLSGTGHQNCNVILVPTQGGQSFTLTQSSSTTTSSIYSHIKVKTGWYNYSICNPGSGAGDGGGPLFIKSNRDGICQRETATVHQIGCAN